MPRTLKLLLLVSTLAAPLRATASVQAARQTPAAAPPTAAAEDNFERGRQLLKEGNATAAAPLLKRAAEARKTDAEAWQQFGVALLRTGKRGDARKAFEKALKARPDWPLARASLAYVLLAQGKARDAEREATRALALDPKLADAHFVLGSVRFHEENFAQAAADAEAALQLNPDFPAAAFLYGDAMLNLYIDESTRQGERYPLTAASDEQTRKTVFEEREAALGPFKARMRENADRLEGFAKSWANAAEAERLRELASSLRLYGRLGGESMGIFRHGEVTTRAIITFKPEPGFTEEARQQNVTGRVRLRAVLAADGQIRNIVAVKRLPAGLTEKCIAVARRIKFTPATLNGSPVSQFVLLEYNFNIY